MAILEVPSTLLLHTFESHLPHTARPSPHLTARHLPALHHGGILLLEPLVQTSRALEVLIDAAHDTLLLAVDEGLGGEIIDAVVETPLHHLGVHLDSQEHRQIGTRKIEEGN